MGYNLLCPSFLGHWEALRREGRKKCRGKWWPHRVLLRLQLNLGWEEAQDEVPLNSEVTPQASVPLARPQASSVKWTSRMVPEVCSQLYEMWILEKGSGEDSLPQHPCMRPLAQRLKKELAALQTPAPHSQVPHFHLSAPLQTGAGAGRDQTAVGTGWP